MTSGERGVLVTGLVRKAVNHVMNLYNYAIRVG